MKCMKDDKMNEAMKESQLDEMYEMYVYVFMDIDFKWLEKFLTKILFQVVAGKLKKSYFLRALKLNG